MLRTIERLAREYGDISYFHVGPRPAYFMNHPDYVREVLVTGHQNFIKGLALQRSRVLLGEGLLTNEGESHRRQRRLAQPAFHRGRIASYAAAMIEYASRTCERWHDGEALDLSEEMMRLTLAIVGKTLFNADVESDAAEVGESMTVVMDLFNQLTIPFFDLLQKLPLPSSRRFQEARARLDTIIYRLINDRRRSGEDHGDLLSMLLLAQDEEGSGQMTDEQVRDEAITIFLAGHETTANALTWAWYLLSQNPAAEAKLHLEVDEVLGRRLATVDDVPRLRYTEMVLLETMRLYPPAWGIGRMVIRECEVGGYKLRPGSLVLMSPFVMHRDARYYPDPLRFDPERWTSAARDARPQFSYFPFGGGPRRCIGEGFAIMEGTLLLATLAQHWQFRRATDRPAVPRPVITLRPKDGMPMIAIRRPESA
jgi:cytochrome P450